MYVHLYANFTCSKADMVNKEIVWATFELEYALISNNGCGGIFFHGAYKQKFISKCGYTHTDE